MWRALSRTHNHLSTGCDTAILCGCLGSTRAKQIDGLKDTQARKTAIFGSREESNEKCFWDDELQSYRTATCS